MFFNEDLYLEADEMDTTSAEATADQAVEEAQEAAMIDPDNNEAVSEGADLYAIGLERMEAINEDYFNLREKMMNMEHIASVKESQGLYSESEMILQESVSSFVDKVKTVFSKIGKLIKELFNRFVNFVSSLFVSTKDVLNMDAAKAWKDKGAKFKLKVKVLNLDPKAMLNIIGHSRALLAMTAVSCVNMAQWYDRNKGVKETEQLKLSYESLMKNTIMRNLTDKATTRNPVGNYLFSVLLDGSTYKAAGIPGSYNERTNYVLQKLEKEIDSKEFHSRISFAKNYKEIIGRVKENRDLALKAVNESIKALDKIKTNTESKEIAMSYTIRGMRAINSTVQSIFSKMISVTQQFYRECVSIGKRVIGSGRVEDTRREVRKITSEGFDFDAYFGV